MSQEQLVYFGGFALIVAMFAWPHVLPLLGKAWDVFAKRENVDTSPEHVDDITTLTNRLKHIVVEWPCEKCDKALPLIRQLEELAQ